MHITDYYLLAGMVFGLLYGFLLGALYVAVKNTHKNPS